MERNGEISSAREPYEKAKIQGYLLKRISRQARNDKKSINNKQKKSTKK